VRTKRGVNTPHEFIGPVKEPQSGLRKIQGVQKRRAASTAWRTRAKTPQHTLRFRQLSPSPTQGDEPVVRVDPDNLDAVETSPLQNRRERVDLTLEIRNGRQGPIDARVRREKPLRARQARLGCVQLPLTELREDDVERSKLNG
jgi:hypothetical protein